MLINILCLIIGITTTFIWIKVVKAKTPIKYQKFAKDKFWLILTGLTIVAIAYLYVYLPQVFKWFSVNVWGISEYKIGEDKNAVPLQLIDLGPLGDIYGSLNTLFTSATLAFVVYATLLQREANKDARNAMADQLQQAKDATTEQLQQAKDATNEQLQQARDALAAQLNQANALTEQQIVNTRDLANIQLEQARESIAQQLALAQASHDAQILESKHAIFASTFNILLNQRNAILENIFTGKEEYKPKEIFEILGTEFERLIMNQWKDLDINNEEDVIIMKKKLHLIMDDRIERSCSYNELISYFFMLIPLLNLIKNSNLSDVDKSLYISVISYSMHHYEQLTLLWFLTSSQDIVVVIEDLGLIDTGFDEKSLAFLIKNFKRTLFAHPKVLENWDHF